MESEADTIQFEDVDIADVKHFQRRPFRQRRTIIFNMIDKADVAIVDIEKMMEKGMNVARFKTSYSTKGEKVNLIQKFDKAAKFLARKYGLLQWPCATCIDLKTNIVETGLLEEEVGKIEIKKDTEVILTSDIEVYDKCNEHRIFVDNPYLETDARIGMEINIDQEEIIMECIEKIDEHSIKCIVTKGGYLKNMAFVCMRGAKRSGPHVTQKDFHILKFAVEYQTTYLSTYRFNCLAIIIIAAHRLILPNLLTLTNTQAIILAMRRTPESFEIVCVATYVEPTLTHSSPPHFVELIRHAAIDMMEMIVVNYPRSLDTILKIKQYLRPALKRPLIIIGISTQEGLECIDDFIREGDGIMFSREFLAYEVERQLYYRMGLIQSVVAGKCRKAGKPFYLSGEVFKSAVLTGVIHARELSDVTNALLQGASGLSMRSSPNIDYLIEAMQVMNELCSSVEPLTMDRREFRHVVSQSKMPVNAAEACAMSCTVAANQTNARCIVVPTVSGRTGYLLNWLRPNSIVIGISTKIRTIRLLKVYRSITPLLYKDGVTCIKSSCEEIYYNEYNYVLLFSVYGRSIEMLSEEGVPRKTWYRSVQARINYAIQYAVEKHWLDIGDNYVTLEKGSEESSFCDTVRIWNVTTRMTTKKNQVECPESYHDFDINIFHNKTVERKKKKRAKEITQPKAEEQEKRKVEEDGSEETEEKD